MGRVDITQNKHYQHQAESQSYQTASLAINMLEKAYDENNKLSRRVSSYHSLLRSRSPAFRSTYPPPELRLAAEWQLYHGLPRR